MIETKAQFLAAYSEIKQLTGWSDAKIAAKSGIDKATLSRILSNPARTPRDAAMKGMEEALIYARGLRPAKAGGN